MESGASSRSASDWPIVVACGAALALGGGTTQGLWSDAIAQLGGLVVILLLSIRLMRGEVRLWSLGPLCFALAVAAISSMQLCLLPPSIWSRLPGRSTIYEGLVHAGVDPPWLPLSLEPEATLRSCLSLIPPIAVFLSSALLGPALRRSMTVAVLSVAALSVLLGVAQTYGGPNSPLRFYEVTNLSSPVGFFANRNHYSALSYCAAVFLGAWSIGWVRDRREGETVKLSLAFLLYATFVFGVLSAGSRAGLFLALLGGLGLAAMALSEFEGVKTLVPLDRIAKGSRLLGVSLLATTALAALAATIWSDKVARIVEEIGAREPRIEIFRTTFRAASSYMPFGAGIGTFASVYQMFEDPQHITPELINRAHNDWLELWLEGGAPSLAVVVILSFGLFSAMGRVWRGVENGVCEFDQRLARASSIVVVLLAIHSLVDYPLRTTGLACVFALACGNLVGWRKVEAVRDLVAALDDRVIARPMRRPASREPLVASTGEKAAG